MLKAAKRGASSLPFLSLSNHQPVKYYFQSLPRVALLLHTYTPTSTLLITNDQYVKFVKFTSLRRCEIHSFVTQYSEYSKKKSEIHSFVTQYSEYLKKLCEIHSFATKYSEYSKNYVKFTASSQNIPPTVNLYLIRY